MQPEWQKSFEPGQRLQARILYVDATSKRVCLTLLPHLVAGQSAPSLPKENTLCQARPWSILQHYGMPHSLVTCVAGGLKVLYVVRQIIQEQYSGLAA